MHNIKCEICGVTLKVKKVPVGKESFKLKCPKCSGVFSINVERLLSENKKNNRPSAGITKAESSGDDILNQILSKEKATPQADKPKTPKPSYENEEPKDIFIQEKPPELYHIIKANGKRLGPVNFTDLIQMAKDGDILGIDKIETASGLKKSPSSFIELKRIFQEKLLEKNRYEESSLGIDYTRSGSREKNKVTFYLLLTLLIIILIIWGFITLPDYFTGERPETTSQLTHIPIEDTEEDLIPVEEEPPLEEIVPVEEKPRVEIINFSERSILEYFNSLGQQYAPAAAQLRNRDYANAIREIDRIILRIGISPTPVILKLQVYLLWEDLERGINDFETMLAVDQSNNIYIALGHGVLNTMLGNFEEARMRLETLRFSAGDNPLVLYYNALLEYRTGNYNRASILIENAIRNSPDNFIFVRDMRDKHNMIRQKTTN